MWFPTSLRQQRLGSYFGLLLPFGVGNVPSSDSLIHSASDSISKSTQSVIHTKENLSPSLIVETTCTIFIRIEKRRYFHILSKCKKMQLRRGDQFNTKICLLWKLHRLLHQIYRKHVGNEKRFPCISSTISQRFTFWSLFPLFLPLSPSHLHFGKLWSRTNIHSSSCHVWKRVIREFMISYLQSVQFSL